MTISLEPVLFQLLNRSATYVAGLARGQVKEIGQIALKHASTDEVAKQQQAQTVNPSLAIIPTQLIEETQKPQNHTSQRNLQLDSQQATSPKVSNDQVDLSIKSQLKAEELSAQQKSEVPNTQAENLSDIKLRTEQKHNLVIAENRQDSQKMPQQAEKHLEFGSGYYDQNIQEKLETPVTENIPQLGPTVTSLTDQHESSKESDVSSDLEESIEPNTVLTPQQFLNEVEENVANQTGVENHYQTKNAPSDQEHVLKFNQSYESTLSQRQQPNQPLQATSIKFNNPFEREKQQDVSLAGGSVRVMSNPTQFEDGPDIVIVAIGEQIGEKADKAPRHYANQPTVSGSELVESATKGKGFKLTI